MFSPPAFTSHFIFCFFSGEGSCYVEDIEKRLERLESEKLELVKVSHRVTVNLHTFLNSQSLSAAHILAATNETENKDLPVCGIYLNAQVFFPFRAVQHCQKKLKLKSHQTLKISWNTLKNKVSVGGKF